MERGRTNLAGQVHVAYVYAQFQRRRGDAHLDLARLQLLLGVEAGGAGQAAVVGHHRFLPQPDAELVRHPLHQPPGIDEHQRRVVGLDQLGYGIQRFAPKLMGCDGAKFLLRQLQCQVNLAGVSGVHDGAVGCSIGGDVLVAYQQPGYLLDGPLRGRQPDTHHRLLRQGAEPLHRQRQVRAALVVGHGVNLVEDQRVDAFQPAPSAAGGEQDVQRFGGGDEDVRRLLRHLLALCLRRIPGAQPDADFGQRETFIRSEGGYLFQRSGQVLLYVIGQRLQRRDVDHLRRVGQFAVNALPHQPVNAGQEGRQRLAGACGRGDERMSALSDRAPALRLSIRGLPEPPLEPLADDVVEVRCGHYRLPSFPRRREAKGIAASIVSIADCRRKAQVSADLTPTAIAP